MKITPRIERIAEALNSRAITTARGGRWYAITVRNIEAHRAA